MPQVSLADFVSRVRSGTDLVSFPTDTVMALASRPDRGEAIYRAKQRSLDKPLILMAAQLEDLLPYVVGTAAEIDVWRGVAARYWPGQLTMVLPASDQVPPAMNPEQTGTIGIRVPDHALARYLLARTGPLATTSANRSGLPPVSSAAELTQQFPQVLTLSTAALASIQAELGTSVESAAIASSGIPSTVVRWRAGEWEMIRQGAVVMDEG